MDTIWAGLNHTVISKKEWFVRKIPTSKNKLSFEQAKASSLFYKRVIPDFVPKTRVMEIQWNSYLIVQQRIHWKTLSETWNDELSVHTLQSLLVFIEAIQDILIHQWVQTDLVGRREGDELPSVQMRKMCIWPFNSMYLFFRLIDIFKSSNIIVDNKGKIWFIDNIWDIAFPDGSIIQRTYKDIYYWNSLYFLYKYNISQILKKRAK